MFTKKKTNKTISVSSLSRYVEGFDIANSKLLAKLSELDKSVTYTITNPKFDVIAKEVYGNSDYAWLVQIILGSTRDQLVRFSTIKLPSLNEVNNLIQSL